ncbi:tetratricopeptide repeat protein [Mucilaginibacter roseus]|uniref:Tetratricopeptide repeat protein n=1 Tax=Mucilaginibacter roseus TaxID=1528868 RepID=A0ABS8U8F4_9SPHI|nr:tetratricopeptide repeat protein [Mucilaginibacter roseus]MCD8742259.1 tetratricopeptide repeat protein [Mucilaginibacter roseus]
MTKLSHIVAAFAVLLVFNLTANAQNVTAKALIDEGMDLHDKGQYKQAIQKYTEALKIEPGNTDAPIELANSYISSGDYTQAASILDKLIISAKQPIGDAYNLRALLYVRNKQSQKAIETYKAGIKNDPGNAALYLSLASLYYNESNNAEAEKYAAEGLKKDYKDVGLHRMYATIMYGQHKYVQGIMASCNVLLLEPNSENAKYVLNHINTGFADAAAAQTTYQSGKYAQAEQFLKKTVVNTSNYSENVSKAFVFELRLGEIFKGVGAISQSIKAPKDFFWSFYADYFYSLEQAGHLPVFIQYISQRNLTAKELSWFKDNQDKVKAFNTWYISTARKY